VIRDTGATFAFPVGRFLKVPTLDLAPKSAPLGTLGGKPPGADKGDESAADRRFLNWQTVALSSFPFSVPTTKLKIRASQHPA